MHERRFRVALGSEKRQVERFVGSKNVQDTPTIAVTTPLCKGRPGWDLTVCLTVFNMTLTANPFETGLDDCQRSPNLKAVSEGRTQIELTPIEQALTHSISASHMTGTTSSNPMHSQRIEIAQP